MGTFCVRVYSDQREVINLYGDNLSRVRELASCFVEKYRVDYAEIREREREGMLIEIVPTLKQAALGT